MKRCTFNPMLVKPKCVWQVAVFLVSADFFRHLRYIHEKWPSICTFLHGLWVKVWSGIVKVSGSIPGDSISIFFMKLVIFLNFSKNFLLTQKTATSQTHFGFTNLGPNMYHFRNRAIWNKKFRFGSPCISRNFCCKFLQFPNSTWCTWFGVKSFLKWGKSFASTSQYWKLSS